MYHRLSQRAGLDRHQAAALEDHEEIFAAIAGRNPNEARRAMRRHLHHVEEHLTSDDSGDATAATARKQKAGAPTAAQPASAAAAGDEAKAEPVAG
jgi:hypothetical protein